MYKYMCNLYNIIKAEHGQAPFFIYTSRQQVKLNKQFGRIFIKIKGRAKLNLPDTCWPAGPPAGLDDDETDNLTPDLKDTSSKVSPKLEPSSTKLICVGNH